MHLPQNSLRTDARLPGITGQNQSVCLLAFAWTVKGQNGCVINPSSHGNLIYDIEKWDSPIGS